jgi:hypothetical protein
MKRLLALFALLSVVPAYADQIGVTVGTGKNIGAALDGSSNDFPGSVICGGATGTVFATVTQCAVVNSSGQLLTLSTLTGTVPLPTGAATETTLGSVLTAIGTPMQATGGTVTAAQATAASLKAQVSTVSGGIASGSVASGAVAAGALAAGAGVDGWDLTQGAKADAAWVSGSGSIVSILKTIAGAGASSSITGWGGSTLAAATAPGTPQTTGLVPTFNVGNTNANGSATSANSSPVVIASDQVAVAVKAASGTFASGSIASGALAAGSISSGAAVSGAYATGAIADLAVAQGATTSGKVGNMGLAAVTTAAPTYTTGQLDPLSLDTAGSLRINCTTGCSASTSITSWGGGTLGAMANYGTSPGAVLVPGVNAAVTALPNVTIGTNAALVAGAALIGKVGIDQTTVGTTNAVSLAQIGAVTTLTGAGASGTGAQRVTVSQDATTVAGAAPNDPCMFVAKTPFAFSSSTGEFQLVAPSGSLHVYICSITLTSTAADSISLVGGTGATCTTGTPAAMLGSTTAANGMALAANAGWAVGSGSGTIYRTITAGHGVCVLQSGTTLVAGGGTFVQQ